MQETRDNCRQVSYVPPTGWMGLEWAITAEGNLHFFGRLSKMPATLAKSRNDEDLQGGGRFLRICAK